jgi:hypothetical protein
MKNMKRFFCISALALVPGLSCPILYAQTGNDAARFNLPTERLYFAALRTARGMGKVLAADENGLTFKFRYAPVDLLHTDIIVTVLPTSETTSSLEMNVSSGGFLSTDVENDRRGKEDAQYYLMQLREALMTTTSDLGSKQCYAAPLAAITAAALSAAKQLGMIPKRESKGESHEGFFAFSKEDPVNKSEVRLEMFQETRSSSCVQVWAQRHKRGGAAWFHKRELETSLFPEFFDLLRKELRPVPSALLRNLLRQKETKTRGAH